MKKIIAVILGAAALLPGRASEGPVMGWSSWNTYRVNISDSLIMRQADVLVELGLDSLGYHFVNIDDGFFGGRDSAGCLKFHPGRFPDGMAAVVRHIHGLGLKAGIYSDAGANTCGNFWDKDSIARGVGLYGHDAQDCGLYFRDLGFDFIKVDFCGGDPRQNSDSLELVPEERYRAIRRAIDATGRTDVRLNVCRWDFPGTWVAEVASSWRISQDITPHWGSVKNIIGQNLYLSAYASPGHYNDMDMLELGRGLSEAEERTHFGMWCMMSSPLLIGCDLTRLPESTLKILRNRRLIELDQSPLGRQAYVAKRDSGCYVLVKDVATAYGLRRAVAFYNPTDTVRQLAVSFADVDLAWPVTAENLWTGERCTEAGDMFEVTVAPHDTEIFEFEGSGRLMRRRYEAETAWLSAYQELQNPQAVNSAYYKADDACSGGMKVTNVGVSEQNDMIFNDVYVPHAGEYTVTLRYSCGADSRVCVAVNGTPVYDGIFSATDGFADRKLKLILHEGGNSVRFYSGTGLLPEFDYMEVEEAGKSRTTILSQGYCKNE